MRAVMSCAFFALLSSSYFFFFFFFSNDTATTEIYTSFPTRRSSDLVFPSQFNRDYEDAPEPKGKAVAITFDGPVQGLYSTLAVRLGHSGLFATGRAEMWRNAVTFNTKAGGKCGLYLHEFAEARGRLILFFDEQASLETRFHFEEFVLAHARKRALDGTVELVRFFVCTDCGDPVPDSYVKR